DSKAEVLLDEVVPPRTEGAADNSPSALDADLNKARAAIKTGYYDDAQRILNDVLARDPKNAAAHSELNKLAALNGDQARRASALNSWEKTAERQVAQAAPAGTAPLKAVFASGTAAAATTASLNPVKQAPVPADPPAAEPLPPSMTTVAAPAMG